jgi:hypothetical protein
MTTNDTETNMLAWHETDPGTWETVQREYAVREDLDGLAAPPNWIARDGDTDFATEPTREAAQAACQQRHDRRLTWREPEGDVWVATCPALPGEDYCVSLSDDGLSELDGHRGWSAQYGEEAIGEPTLSLEVSQAVCQGHAWRDIGSPAATEPPPAPEPVKLKWRKVRGEERWEADGYEIRKTTVGDGVMFDARAFFDTRQPVDLGPFEQDENETDAAVLKRAKAACERHAAGEREAPAATGKPRRELVRRSILVELTPEEQAEAGRKLAEAGDAVDDAEADLAGEAERHKAEKKRLEGLVEAKKSEVRGLRGPARDGTEWRDLEVHEQLAPDDGTGAARDVIYTCPVTGAELDRRPATRAELQKWLPGYEPDETPPEPPPEPSGDDDEPDPDSSRDGPPWEDDEQPDPLPADRPLPWEHDTVDGERQHIAGSVEGEHYRLGKDEGLWQPIYRSADGGVRVLAGRHKRLRDAKAMAEADNQARLRWGFLGEGIILSKCGAYQLTEHVATGPGTNRDRWSATHVGGLDGSGTVLTDEPLELPAAQAACQAHADERRAVDRTDGEARQ